MKKESNHEVESRLAGRMDRGWIFGCFFVDFWDPKPIKNQLKSKVGKRCEKRSDQKRQGSRNERLQHRAGEGVDGHGKGVGGIVTS